MRESIAKDLEELRSKRPLVHNITNYVVMNETANALLCIGALPIMAHAAEEVEEMVGVANALVLNIGTLSPDWIDAMVMAGKRANALGVPVVLDPVGAGATKLRTESCRRILDEVKVGVIRGNAAEVAVLAGFNAEIRGVESIGHEGDAGLAAAELAIKRGCVVAVTGPVDAVSDGSRIARISNGSAMLGRVTGTGCMSTTMIAAFAGAQSDLFRAAVSALAVFGIAGELAAEESGERPGSFHVALYDALAATSVADVRERVRTEMTEVVNAS